MFQYQPSLQAQFLRLPETKTFGILVSVLSDGYHTDVLSGIVDCLMEREYFYFIAHHSHCADLVEKYPRLLVGRGAEGMIIVDTHLAHELLVPAAAGQPPKDTRRDQRCARPPQGVATGAHASLQAEPSRDCVHARAAVQLRLRYW